MGQEIIVREKSDPLNSGIVSFDERTEELAIMDEIEARKKKSRYTEWAQLNLRNDIAEALTGLAKNANAMQIFLYIVKHMDNYNAVLVSYKTMQEALGLSKASVSRGVKYLADNNYLYIMKSGTSNVYVMNPDVVWKSHGDNVKFCEFPVNAVLSASEQTPEFDKYMRKRINTVVDK